MLEGGYLTTATCVNRECNKFSQCGRSTKDCRAQFGKLVAYFPFVPDLVGEPSDGEANAMHIVEHNPMLWPMPLGQVAVIPHERHGSMIREVLLREAAKLTGKSASCTPHVTSSTCIVVGVVRRMKKDLRPAYHGEVSANVDWYAVVENADHVPLRITDKPLRMDVLRVRLPAFEVGQVMVPGEGSLATTLIVESVTPGTILEYGVMTPTPNGMHHFFISEKDLQHGRRAANDEEREEFTDAVGYVRGLHEFATPFPNTPLVGIITDAKSLIVETDGRQFVSTCSMKVNGSAFIDVLTAGFREVGASIPADLHKFLEEARGSKRITVSIEFEQSR